MLAERDKPDIRIVRLAISMFKSPLRHYYRSAENWELGLRYCDAPQLANGLSRLFPEIDYAVATRLFQGLYTNNPEIFPGFLEYTLKDYVKEKLKTGHYELHHISSHLAEIEKELLALGYQYDIKAGKLISTLGTERQKYGLETALDSMLAKVDPALVAKRHGAWEAFTSKSSDAFAQSVSSARELLNQCITKLAPNEKTRKDKVRHILRSKSGTELIEAIATVVDKLYGSLSQGTHRKATMEMALYAITTVENTLYLLLMRRH